MSATQYPDSTDDRHFLKRTLSIYGNQRARAKKDHQTLGYTLAELRAKANHAVTCCYCGCCLTTENLSVDHRKPVSRGGGWELANMQIVCRHCNECKHVLDHAEFGQLMAVVLRLSPQAQSSVLTRLRRGPIYRGKRGR